MVLDHTMAGGEAGAGDACTDPPNNLTSMTAGHHRIGPGVAHVVDGDGL